MKRLLNGLFIAMLFALLACGSNNRDQNGKEDNAEVKVGDTDRANIPPAISILESNHPPNISPNQLVSSGIATSLNIKFSCFFILFISPESK